MSTSTLSVDARLDEGLSAERLAVAWQHPGNRRIQPVGVLTCSAMGFAFSYLRSAAEVEGFQPFLGFPDLDRRYESATLFPLFAQRVMRSSRPDYDRYLRALWLDDDASAWSILGRSQGQREGDGIRVFPEPSVDDDGRTISTFFVSGLRHRMTSDPRVERALETLAVGDALTLRDEPDNPADERALLVEERTGVDLAWVPSVLLDYVHAVRSIGTPAVTVTTTNGAGVPPGYRLLVTVEGAVPPGYRPFSGAEWALASGD